jgi:PAS domain S-box-containing protein
LEIVMPERKSGTTGNRRLREDLENRLSRNPKKSIPGTPKDFKAVSHELQVHQIELEMQNEELRRAHHEIEESRERYADLYDFAPVGYLTFNEKGLICQMNLTAGQLLGVERELLINKPFSLFVKSKSQDTFYLHRQKVLQSETRQTCELVLKKKNGIVFDAQLESTASEVSGSRVIRTTLTDITERKRAEEKIRESEDRFRTLANAIPQLAWIAKNDGYIFWYNQRWFDYTGTTPDEMEGWGWQRVHDPEVLPRVLEKWRASIATGSPFDMVFPLRGANGEFRSFLTRVMPLKNSSGEVIQWFGTNTDITERKLAEEALQKGHDLLEQRVQERTKELLKAYETLKEETQERAQIEERLRQSQKMEAMGTLAGGIAHDFNNILAAILGFTEMAVDDVPDRPLVAKNLQHVLKSAMRARELVKQILAFGRKAGHTRGPVSVFPLIKETVQLLRASIPSTIDINLALSASSDTILAAPIEVQQILMNLATNASLAMQEKGGTMEISLTDIDSKPDSSVPESDLIPGEYLQLVVKDTGIGMSLEVKRRVFEPFFTTREVGKGSGMGLAVVYGIVQDLQGTITVESEPGVGSTFRVLLPKARTEAKEEQLHTSQVPRGKESILFVDDEDMLAEWGQAILERLEYAVTAVTDSTAALNTFSSDPTRFDLVITDQTMPGMTGVQLSEELLKIRPDIPIILCTGHSETVSPETAKEVGIRQFLMKPLIKQELAQAVRKVLDEKNLP